jgi:hypothetical protein
MLRLSFRNKSRQALKACRFFVYESWSAGAGTLACATLRSSYTGWKLSFLCCRFARDAKRSFCAEALFTIIENTV